MPWSRKHVEPHHLIVHYHGWAIPDDESDIPQSWEEAVLVAETLVMNDDQVEKVFILDASGYIWKRVDGKAE